MIYFAEHDGGMSLAALQLRQTFQCFAALFVMQAEHGEGHQHLVGVQARVVPVQQVDLGLLDGLDHLLRDQLHVVVDVGQMLGGVEQPFPSPVHESEK